MITSIRSRLSSRASRSFLNSNSFFAVIGQKTRCREFANASTNDMTLPLKGYKVLDMTRVLAGVSYSMKVLTKAF